jgi:dipeptide/tripeptide permease
MGINVGALLGPLVAGYLAQRVNWHVGFASAGVGMALGLIQLALGRTISRRRSNGWARRPRSRQPRGRRDPAGARAGRSISGAEWKRIAAIAVFFSSASCSSPATSRPARR